MNLRSGTVEHYLGSPISSMEGVGPKRAALLANLGVHSVGDLLSHVPRTYEDRRRFTPIAQAAEGMEVTIRAEVVRARNIRLRGRLSLAEVTVRDETAEIRATFFGRGFLARTFAPGAILILTGTVGRYNGLALKNPEYELLTGGEEDALNTGRIVPVYRLTEGLTQRMLRRWTRTALDGLPDGPDPLPRSVRARRGWPEYGAAIRAVHYPDEMANAEQARQRFAYEEFLAIQLGVLRQRARRMSLEQGIQHPVDGPLLRRLRESLPFTLTGAQVRAVEDILRDMASPRPMFRLLHGDVGCGKTAVALHAMAAAADGRRQTALMAPTEALAEQHFLSIADAIFPLGLRVELLTGSMRGAAAARRRVASGEADIVIGTHALIQEATEFRDLGLAVIDEQHRFGVAQRGRLVAKGACPDVLQMSATPIPRTLAITVYGAMDLTLIDEMPPGRLPIQTRVIPEAKVAGLYAYIREQAEKGFQTYIVCPVIDESETRELKAVTAHFEEVSTGPLAGLRTALLHGRMESGEKDAIMRRFKAGRIDALFSTTVIEVGIDAPRATTMVIEDAPQFGLTQLHQLRGRVGRGPYESYCFLLGKPATDDGKRRVEILCSTASGFEIAEEDLKLRGPGEALGVRQAGLSDLRAADLLRDIKLLEAARQDAEAILEDDPDLSRPEHRTLAQRAQVFERVAADGE